MNSSKKKLKKKKLHFSPNAKHNLSELVTEQLVS